MERKNKKKIDDFVKAVNSKIANSSDFKNRLNQFVKDNLPKEDEYFGSLKEFANFLPEMIKNIFNDKKNLSDLGEQWQDLEEEEIKKLLNSEKDDSLGWILQASSIWNNKYSEMLYGINLDLETKVAIIRKFNMEELNKKAGSLEKSNRLNKEDAETALEIFKKILGQDKVSATDFNAFIKGNIKQELSFNADDLLECLDLNSKGDVFKCFDFVATIVKFQSLPSKKFIDFMVQNTNFNKLSSAELFASIYILTDKAKEKENTEEMVGALDNILNGQDDRYKVFSQALFNVPDIKSKINLEKIVEERPEKPTRQIVFSVYHAAAWMLRGINIEVDKGNNRFIVSLNKEKKLQAGILNQWFPKGSQYWEILVPQLMYHSDTFKKKSIHVEYFISLLQSSDFKCISLSELKRIMWRDENFVQDGVIVKELTKEQQSEFTKQIADGKIVISSNLSEVFSFNNGNDAREFVKTNVIARKFIYEDIYDQLFNSETGLFTKNDVKDSKMKLEIYNNINKCFKSIEIVLRNNNKITVDFSAYKDEFLSLVGLVDVAALFQHDKKSSLSSWLKTRKFKISDRNFDSFLNLIKSNIEDIKLEDFTYWLEKIEDSSLGYDNVKGLVELLLSREDFNNFGLIKQLIDKKLKPIKDGDDRFYYNSAAVDIFSKVCERAEKLDDASGIILILDALIRKQDECYQCGKLIDALNEACAKTKFNIDSQTFKEARDSIKNKIFVTDVHTSADGYKFVIDFQLTEEGYLTIPINVEYLDEKKNQKVNSGLNEYIGNHIDKLDCKCNISDKKSFDNIISQIKGWFNDKNGNASGDVVAINKNCNSIDSSDDNFIYVLKSKSKLSKDTLKAILSGIFDNKNKIKDESVFFEQFGPWFCHVLSNYLDFSTLDKFGLSSLLEVCIGKKLEFQSVDKLTKFLESCIEATKKNNKSCVDLNFVINIVRHINPDCDMGSVFEFMYKNIYQINRIENKEGIQAYKNSLNLLVSVMVVGIWSCAKLTQEDKQNKTEKLINQLNEKCLYGLVITEESYSIHVDNLNIDNKVMQTIQIGIDKNGFINKISASPLNMVEVSKNEKENNPGEITLFDSSNRNFIDNGYKRGQIKSFYDQQEREGNKESKKENETNQENIKNAMEVWSESKEAKEQADNENKKRFLLKEVRNEFDNAFTKAFGNLNENQKIGKYDKFEDFLDDVQKIWDLVKICVSNGDLKVYLMNKVEEFKSRISKNSLTFKQILKLVDLICDIKDSSISIAEFLDDWCKNYLKEDGGLEYKLPEKVQIGDSICDTLEVFKFVVSSKKDINKYDDAKKEIQTFLSSGLFGNDFKLKHPNPNAYLSTTVENAVSNVVSILVQKCDKIDDTSKDAQDAQHEMEDMFFTHLNKNILKDKDLHIQTNKEKENELMEKERQKREKENEEEKNKKGKELVGNKAIYNQLFNNLENFLKTKDPTIKSVKNIFEDVKISDIKSTVTFKEYAVEESEQIDKFINLLSQVNEKVKQVNIEADKNKENEDDVNNIDLADLTNLTNLFKSQSLSGEQFNTFTAFIASMQYHLTGNKLSFQTLYADYGKLLKMKTNENAINEDNEDSVIDYVKNVFKAYENSTYIFFENADYLFNFLESIKFKGKTAKTKQDIVDLINEYNIFGKALYDEFISYLDDNVNIDDQEKIEHIRNRIEGNEECVVGFCLETIEGCQIQIGKEKIEINKNNKEKLVNELVDSTLPKLNLYEDKKGDKPKSKLPKVLCWIAVILAVLTVISLLNGVGVFGTAVLVSEGASLTAGGIFGFVAIFFCYGSYKANQIQSSGEQIPPGGSNSICRNENGKNSKKSPFDLVQSQKHGIDKGTRTKTKPRI